MPGLVYFSFDARYACIYFFERNYSIILIFLSRTCHPIFLRKHKRIKNQLNPRYEIHSYSKSINKDSQLLALIINEIAVIYSKTVLFQTDLSIDPKIKIQSYPGLYVLFETVGFEYNSNSRREKLNWSELSQKTVSLCFLKLLSEKLKNIKVVKSEYNIFFKLIRYKKVEYHVSIDNQDAKINHLEDFLTKELFACIIFRSKRNGGKADLKRVVEFLMARSYYHYEEDNKPAKTFLTTVLNKHCNQEWLKINTNKHGLYTTYGYEIDYRIKKKISEEFQTMDALIESIGDENIADFNEYIKKQVARDF